MKSARHLSREFAVQSLYQWLLAKHDTAQIAGDIALFRGYDKCDAVYFRELLDGVVAHAPEIEAAVTPCLDRPLKQLAPIERAILMIAACEFQHHLDVPYRVVINEAVELAKVFGGTDGHKFVNGVLDKLATVMREPEVRESRESRIAKRAATN